MNKETPNYDYYKSLKQSPLFSNVSDSVLPEILEMFHSKKISRRQLSAYISFNITLYLCNYFWTYRNINNEL